MTNFTDLMDVIDTFPKYRELNPQAREFYPKYMKVNRYFTFSEHDIKYYNYQTSLR